MIDAFDGEPDRLVALRTAYEAAGAGFSELNPDPEQTTGSTVA